MKTKHLWFLIPTFFAMIFVELININFNAAIVILPLILMIYTLIIALNKNDL